ncbi:hypothetical protein T281_14155 [Rhodomicrobium udaipurense JA643]|nr:hypothetical protein T281_14155 [Rhodomicrobium udaipurense JA643]
MARHCFGSDGNLRQPIQRSRGVLVPAPQGVVPLVQQGAMINPRVMACQLQRPIGMECPLLAPAHEKGIAVPCAGFHAGKPVPVRCPQGQQHVGVKMPGIAFPRKGIMEGKIGNHPARHKLFHHEPPDQRQPLFGRQFMWQGDVEFTGELGITALLKLLGMVPEGLAVAKPARCPLGQEDFLMHHPLLGAVVKNDPLTPVLQTFGRPVGRNGDNRSATTVVVTRNDLRLEVIDGHRDGFVAG